MNQQEIKRLEDWIDEHFQALVEDIARVVRVPSVATYEEPGYVFGKGCQDVLNEMIAMAQSYGFQTRNYENHCGSASFHPLCAPENEIGIWGHLDVVPEGEGWLLTEPFHPVVKNGYLIGRGADDNKAPVIGVMYILRAYHELNIPLRHGLRLFFGCDEEHGMRDVQYYSENYPANKINIVADCGLPACFGEKGVLDVDIVSRNPMETVTVLNGGTASNIIPDQATMRVKGNYAGDCGKWCECKCEEGETVFIGRGLSGHTAFPEGSANAIHAVMTTALASGQLSDTDAVALSFMKRVNDDFYGTAIGIDYADEMSGKTTCVGSIASLDAEGHAMLHLNIRYCITAKAEDMIQNISAACKANGCEIKNVKVNAPNYFPRENPVLMAMTRAFQEITGLKTQPYVMSGGTYARKLPNAFGFGMGGLEREETTLFAPGHGSYHQPDEGLHLASFKRALLIFAAALLEADRALD